jgi:hypothetical protein
MEEIKNPPEARLARGGKNILKRFFLLLKKHEFHFFVLVVYLLILSWPYLSYLNNKSLSFSFVYYFAAWLALVVFLLVANAIGSEEDNSNDD